MFCFTFLDTATKENKVKINEMESLSSCFSNTLKTMVFNFFFFYYILKKNNHKNI